MDWHEQDGVRWLETSLGTARAVFSTRVGGVSEGAFATLNLGVLTDDDPKRVYENRSRLCSAVGVEPTAMLAGHQVHGAEVALRSAFPDSNPFSTPGMRLEPADAQATALPGAAALVFVADCLPVMIVGDRGVAAVHCGWRPMAAGIIASAVEAVGGREAAIGPGIGRCCYEVGPEVLAAFADLGEGIADGRMLDLTEVARRQLKGAGVSEVQSADLCTRCNPELFFSHRRDGGRTGRQAGIVATATEGA